MSNNNDMSTVKDITIISGSRFMMDMEYVDDNNVTVSLSGYTAYAQLREYPESNTAFDFTCTIVNNNIQMIMPPETTSKIYFPKGVYDLILVDGDMNPYEILHGKADIIKGVIR
jgi:hypothetical protein